MQPDLAYTPRSQAVETADAVASWGAEEPTSPAPLTGLHFVVSKFSHFEGLTIASIHALNTRRLLRPSCNCGVVRNDACWGGDSLTQNWAWIQG
jgi:hypothetical protein